MSLKNLRNLDSENEDPEYQDVPFSFVIEHCVIQIMESDIRDVDVQHVNRGFISIPSYDLRDKKYVFKLLQGIVFFRALRLALP